MRNALNFRLVAVATVGISGTVLHSQGSTASTKAPTVITGSRMVIFDSDAGTFLVDNNTGRVWRYTRLTLPDAELQPFVETEEFLKKTELGRELTPQERAEIKQNVKAKRAAAVNPCQGTGACFLEVDRGRLTADGWTSEIVKKP